MLEKRKQQRARIQAQSQHDSEIAQIVRTLVGPPETLSPTGEAEFFAACHRLGYTEGGVVQGDRLPAGVLDTVMLAIANDGRRPPENVELPLRAGEQGYCARQAALLKEITDREFRGGSRGISVPIGGGVRLRTGAVRGRSVTIGTHWETADTGLLTITSRRIVYSGTRKTLEFQLAKLATLNTYTDAIDLGVTNRQSTSSFRVANPDFIAGMIRAALNRPNP
jgi:hypothetical protein